MKNKTIIAMLLAGGQGSRLGVLTNRVAKPAVPFGGKYRIIDFPLSNCINSDIETVGVLTQYQPLELNSYLGNGQTWDLDRNEGGMHVLPPYVKGSKGEWYKGTANAIYQNIPFVDQFNPKYVLILSGDHIYKMDYGKMLSNHIKNSADATIAVLNVPLEEAHRFGIMNTDGLNRITEFQEKPKQPISTKASMGIYIFSWQVLKEYLNADEKDKTSNNDFGQNIIPNMLADDKRMFAYEFSGYWRDVGTVTSLWESNMDLLTDPPELDLYEKDWRIYGKTPNMPPHFAGESAVINNSIVAEGAVVNGSVTHSVIFTGVKIGKGAVITDSIIMPNTVICDGAVLNKTIVGENAVIGANSVLGVLKTASDKEYDTSLTGDITLVESDVKLKEATRIPVGMVVSYKSERGNK